MGKNMTTQSPQSAQSTERAGRLVELLELLSTQGISQSQVARRTGVPSQYLTDVRRQRRPLTELFARRLGEEFDFNFRWLLGEEESSESTCSLGAVISGGNKNTDGERSDCWQTAKSSGMEGGPLEISGLAAAKAAAAERPYILQLSHDAGRLKTGDLVLVAPNQFLDPPELSVVRSGKEILIAEKKGAKWLRAATRKPLAGKCDIVGHCVAIVWASLT